MGASSGAKNQKRRQRKKRQREEELRAQQEREALRRKLPKTEAQNGQAGIEYVAQEIPSAALEGMEGMKEVIERFAAPKRPERERAAAAAAAAAVAEEEEDGEGKKEATHEDDAAQERRQRLGRRKRKAMLRFTVAELKQIVDRPDLVEAHDVASPNPLLLLHLKATRNTVPVPRHWANPRKYLQGKRGKERVSYVLPEFIASTGINKIRAALAEQEATETTRRKGRNRVNPGMGKMAIDYQVLYDAFFIHQTKPVLRGHGEVYYDGADNETAAMRFKPGQLSSTMREALEIPPGGPPPWIFQMQRYGPPPAYPGLKIPGVNAPIPKGASWGLHPGGWGNAPVDQLGRGLYGDVFASSEGQNGAEATAQEVKRWGEMESGESESESESESEDEDGDEDEDGEDGEARVEQQKGLGEPSKSSPTRAKTTAPEDAAAAPPGNDGPIDLRKPGAADTPSAERALFQVLEQKTASAADSGAAFGSSYGYAVDQDRQQQGADVANGKGAKGAAAKGGGDAEAAEDDADANFRF